MKVEITVELGSGKINPDIIREFSKNRNKIYIAVDRCHKTGLSIKDIEQEILDVVDSCLDSVEGRFITCGEDIFKFVENLPFKVDNIIANRILEHIHLKDIMYFLFLLHSLLKSTGKLNFMVPNHTYYAKEILRIDNMIRTEMDQIKAIDLYNSLLNITTEFCNESSDPHMSIWSEELTRFYLETEGYWTIESIVTKTIFNNRNYILVCAKPNPQIMR